MSSCEPKYIFFKTSLAQQECWNTLMFLKDYDISSLLDAGKKRERTHACVRKEMGSDLWDTLFSHAFQFNENYYLKWNIDFYFSWNKTE